MSFLWAEYLNIARVLTENSNASSCTEAYLRSAISRAYYDVHSDVLYAWWKKPQEVVCVEPDEGIVLRLDAANTDQLVGYTLIGFRRRFGPICCGEKLILPLIPESAIPDEVYGFLLPSGEKQKASG
jgi:hypothetical protein